MKFTRLGRSGLTVSRLCLGTMNFGKLVPEAECDALLNAAVDKGVNFIDTADVYGGIGFRGRTEEIIGRWLAATPGARDSIVLATKVYGKMTDAPNDSRLSAYHIRRACEASLRRLQTDHIDLYQMHHIVRDTPWDEIWQAMEQLVREGKITYTGSSNFAGWHITQAQAEASRRNFPGLISEQSLYNLSNRTVELEVLPACRALGIGVIPWSPLAGGLLGGTDDPARIVRRANKEHQERMEKHGPRVARYNELCARAGLQPSQVALAWLLTNPAVTAPIIGPRTLAQLESNLQSLDLTLTGEFLKELDAIWPGPGGEAPEAYAW